MNIYTVAKSAGVSPATVSRVINGKSDVKQSTRQRVLETMESLNFQPRVSRVGLKTVAVVAPMGEVRTRYTNYFSDIVLGASGQVFSDELSLLVVSLRQIPRNPLDFAMFCREQRICCGVFVQTRERDAYLKEVLKDKPFVIIGDHFGDALPYVASDNFTGGYTIAKHIVESGHRRISIVSADLSYPDHIRRIEGYKKALAEAGISVSDESIIDTNERDATMMGNRFRIRAMLTQQEQPTAILTTNTVVATDVIHIIHELGLRIPEDISVASFDDDVIGARLSPPLTTVRQPVYELGIEAAKLALGLYSGDIVPQEARRTLATEFLVRSSTGAPPQKKETGR